MRLSRRHWLLAGGALLLLAAFALRPRYPSDRTPEGAYYRIVAAVTAGDTIAIFPYLETRAQHAAFTIQHYAAASHAIVSADFPEPERTEQLEALNPLATQSDGAQVFALYAAQHGWIARLRRDLSGIARVDVEGERATVETARGTRYAFRIRENGIWGLTLFTAQLVAYAEKGARDHAIIQAAGADYRAASRNNAPRVDPAPSDNPVGTNPD